jgi:hypothetical protein
MGSGESKAGQREPHEWLRTTVRTLCKVDTCDRLHPLYHTGWVAWGGIGGLAQEFPTAAQRPRFVPVGEEAVMPETHEAVGEHMQEEAADKFVGVERHGLGSMTLTPVPVGQADPSIAYIEDAVVRDGNAMGIAADIVQDVLRAGKGGLGVDHPLFGIQLGTKRCEVRRASSGDRLPRAEQSAGGPEPGQRLTELSAKNGTQGSHWKQEARISLYPAHPVRRERASRHEAMDMEMCPQGLIPGMEDHGTPDLSTKVALPKLHERLTRRFEQQGQQRSFVREDEGVEDVW